LHVNNRNKISVDEVFGVEKFVLLKSNIYRDQYLQGSEFLSNQFNILSQLAKKIAIYRIERPTAPIQIDELADIVYNRIINPNDK
jgi:hypothetical protein